MSTEIASYTRTQFKKEFAKLMEKTSLPNTLSQEESIKVIKNLHDFVQPHIPTKLFRFRKCGEKEIVSFNKGTISMCVAEKFSDKYDSTVFYNHRTLSKRFAKSFELVMPQITKILRHNQNALPSNSIVRKILELINSNTNDSEIAKLLKPDYNSFLEQMTSEIQKQEIWPRNNRYTKIGCFTENIDSKFMWDHYADGYKGFALEYDFRKWYELQVNLYPVIYSTKMLNATEMIERICITNYFDSIMPEKAYKETFELLKTIVHMLHPIDSMYFIKMYLYKDKMEYSHEREWRMLKFDRETTDQDYINIPDKGSLKAIYYGPDIEPNHKIHLRKIAKAKGIKEYNIILDKKSRKYILKVVPLWG
jgi:hypothetical protein